VYKSTNDVLAVGYSEARRRKYSVAQKSAYNFIDARKSRWEIAPREELRSLA
jgi:hypothetical protein